ncbi:MAG: HD domain-containing protein [Spirochaetota bacterium]|nr:HD domain-containing protein [Spirochaetota bacterium]
MIRSKRIKIDLSYLRPNSCFVYPIYSLKGEKIFDARVILTQERLKMITEKYGNIVFREWENIPDYRKKIAFCRSREIMEEVSATQKLSENSFLQAEDIIEAILDDLTTSEIEVVNLLKDLKDYDEYIYNHSVNVGILSAIFAIKLGLFSLDEIRSLTLAAYLHDIGEMKIDKQLLEKEGELDASEMKEIEKHPQLSYEMIKCINRTNRIIEQSVLFHHERYNNQGYYMYPYVNLPLYPKIISICDIYDSLTSKRPYRDAISPSHALKSIVNSSNGLFDYNLVSNFINKIGPILNNAQVFYSTNEICELNTKELAIIVSLGIEDLLKPRVLVFCRLTKENGRLVAQYYDHPLDVNLNDDPSRIMTKILDNQMQINAIKERLPPYNNHPNVDMERISC